MKIIQVKCLGIQYPCEVPESVEEYDQLAGRTGAARDSAVSNLIYRKTNAEFRRDFIKLVTEATGVEVEQEVKGQKTETDEDGNETTVDVYGPAESEKSYFDRVCAKLGLKTEEEKMDCFKDQMEEMGVLVADPSERVAAPKKATKTFMKVAECIAEQVGDEGLKAVAEKLADKVGHDVEPTVEGIALAIQENEKKQDLASKYGV